MALCTKTLNNVIFHITPINSAKMANEQHRLQWHNHTVDLPTRTN